MLPRVYKEFERICAARNAGGQVLEIGVVPNETSLLNMKSIRHATRKVGINVDGPYTWKDFEIRKGNANCSSCLPDESFDTVLCNAVLEHDRLFWKTISEIGRVTKSGGIIVIGTPGSGRSFAEKPLGAIIRRVPLVRRHGGRPSAEARAGCYDGSRQRGSDPAYWPPLWGAMEPLVRRTRTVSLEAI